jgi:hypothetical protein
MTVNAAPSIHAFLGTLTMIVTLAWIVLLIISLSFRPKPAPGMRVIERMLIVTSTLMILCFGAAYLALQSRAGG